MKKRINATWLRPLAAAVLISLLALLTAGCGGGGGGTSTPTALAITTTSPLTPYTLGSGAFAPVTLEATGGTAPYTWAVAPLSTLPAGLTLSAGVLSGTPTTAGTFNFSLQVTDSQVPAVTVTKAFSLVVSPATTPTTLNAILSATQEVPPTTSTATGTATVTVDAAKTTINVTLNTAGLTNVTASHIHFGKAGVNGGIMFSLFAAPATFTSPLTKTLTSADFTATTGVATFAEAVDAILAGNTYINVHTQANAGGEIRGQIGPVSLAAATMTGGQENPPVTSSASGNATVKFDNTQSTLTVTVNTTGLVNVTASHIHFGKPGANGGVLFSLFAAPATFTSPLTKTLTSADFTPDAVNGINTFADAVNAILSGNTYVNVHTVANAGGEIRGQVGPAAFKATLDGATEVPAVVSPATGTATIRLNADQTAIALNMTTQGFVNTVTASHIHFGAAGANGGVLFSLFAAPGTFPATLSKTLTSTEFTADAANGITTFANALNAMLSSKTYINVHTNINAGGEIRGQVTSQ